MSLWKRDQQYSRVRFVSSGGKVLYSYADADEFIYMYPAGLYSHLLVSLWEGGSHVAIRVFRVGNASVDKVFDAQLKVAPDVITSSDDQVVIIASNSKSGDIDISNGKAFSLVQTVAFSQRFLALGAAMNREGRAISK
jgi:hypothetical protein